LNRKKFFRRALLIFALFSLIISGCERLSFKKKSSKLPILMYHRVDIKKPNKYWVEVDMFEAQMAALKKAGFQTVTFPQVEAHLKGKKPLPRKAVLLTFDDGFRDFYLYAYPVLKKHGFKGTVFLISGTLADDDSGRLDSRWTGDPKEEWNLHLIWPEIKEMADYGIEFGGHSMTHPSLTNQALTDEDLWREINGCKVMLEEHLGQRIISFAYPGGDNDERVRGLVKKAGYKFAVGSKGGTQENIEESDPFAFKRLAVFNQDASQLMSQITAKDSSR